jgi:hypothetical protein
VNRHAANQREYQQQHCQCEKHVYLQGDLQQYYPFFKSYPRSIIRGPSRPCLTI